MSKIQFEAPDSVVQEAIDEELALQRTFNSLLARMEQCKIQLKRLIADIETITDLASEKFQGKNIHRCFANHKKSSDSILWRNPTARGEVLARQS